MPVSRLPSTSKFPGESPGESPAGDGPLSADQIARFNRDGYVVVPGLFGSGLFGSGLFGSGLFGSRPVADIRAWTDEVQDWPEMPGKWMMYFEQDAAGRRLLNRMEDVLPWHEGFRALAESACLVGGCAQLFGEPAVLFKDKINFKQAGGGGFEPHQDVQAGWSRYASLHITALVTVDTANRDNGCLEMAEGCGRGTLIGAEWEPLTDAQLRDLAWRPIEAAPGDAVFFDSFVPHRSGPNRTSGPRRVLYYTYNRASEGNHLRRYYADKRRSYPPDIERETGREYRYRV